MNLNKAQRLNILNLAALEFYGQDGYPKITKLGEATRPDPTAWQACDIPQRETLSNFVKKLDKMFTPTEETIGQQIKKRLEYLRGEIRAERISYGEIAELVSLAGFIDRGDVELLEWAGVPEFPEEKSHA